MKVTIEQLEKEQGFADAVEVSYKLQGKKEKIKGLIYALLVMVILAVVVCLCGTSDYQDAKAHAQHPNYGKYEAALL